MKQGWEIKKLGDVAAVCSGNSAPQKKELYKNGCFPFIRTSDVGQIRMGFISSCVDYLNNDGVKGLKLHKKGTILFPKSGASTFLNHRVMMEIDGYVSSHLATIKGNDSIMKDRFLLYFLTTIDARDLLQNIAYPSLKISDIRLIPIPIPPLPEQQRIVSILDEVFTAIANAKANAEQNLKNAKELFESYLQGVFENKGEGWKEKPLSELCNVKHGFAFKGEYFRSSGEFVLLTPGNFYESGGYRNREEKQKYYIGEIPNDYVLKKGDLLVAMTEQASGLLGSPILVPESNKFLHNQRLGLIIPKKNFPWSNEFFFHVFNTREVRRILHKTGTGIKVRHTSPSKIGEVIVGFPSSTKVQNEIVKTLAGLSAETKKLETIYQQKIKNLDELKKSVLQKAFAGELKT